MICSSCGNQVDAGAKFCKKCGKQLFPAIGRNNMVGGRTAIQGKGYSIASLVCAIIFVLSTLPLCSVDSLSTGTWILFIMAVLCFILSPVCAIIALVKKQEYAFMPIIAIVVWVLFIFILIVSDLESQRQQQAIEFQEQLDELYYNSDEYRRMEREQRIEDGWNAFWGF